MESMDSEVVNANDINSSQISLFKSEFLDKIPLPLSNNLKLENISEDKCPICLAEMKDPTALSDCIHMFCFNCIEEWLNMKPECPLCKQNYEMNFILPQTTTPAFEERKAVQSVIEKLRKEITLLKSSLITTAARRSVYLKAIQELEDERQTYADLDNMFAICSRQYIFNQPAFRRVVYAERLYAQSIVPPRCNVVFTADYIRKHTKMIQQQILPFMARDLAPTIDIDAYMKKAMEYLMDKIDRNSIVKFLKETGVRGPVMFINNLKHFVTTGQTIEVYDQNSTYTARWLRGLDYDNDEVEFLGGNNDILYLGNDEIQLLNAVARPGPTIRYVLIHEFYNMFSRRRPANERTNVVTLVSSSEDDSDIEIDEGGLDRRRKRDRRE